MSQVKDLEKSISDLTSSLDDITKNIDAIKQAVESIKNNSSTEAKIIWLRGMGYTWSAIAEELDLNKSTVYLKARRLGLINKEEK